MPAHASRTLAPAPSAPPSGPERRLLAPAPPGERRHARRTLRQPGSPPPQASIGGFGLRLERAQPARSFSASIAGAWPMTSVVYSARSSRLAAGESLWRCPVRSCASADTRAESVREQRNEKRRSGSSTVGPSVLLDPRDPASSEDLLSAAPTPSILLRGPTVLRWDEPR